MVAPPARCNNLCINLFYVLFRLTFSITILGSKWTTKPQKSSFFSKTSTKRDSCRNEWRVCPIQDGRARRTYLISYSRQLRHPFSKAGKVNISALQPNTNSVETKEQWVDLMRLAQSATHCLKDIDQTLARIEDLAHNQDDIAADESLILRGYAVAQSLGLI